MDCKQQITDFLSHLKHELILSDKTYSSYQIDLKQFLNYITENNITNLDNLSLQDINNFIFYLRKVKITPRAINRKLSCLNSFFKFLVDKKIISKNIVKEVKRPKFQQALPKALDVDLINKILSKQGDDFITVRDLTIMELLYSTGFRLSEIININLSDLNIDDLSVKTLGKGKKERIGLINKPGKVMLSKYLLQRQLLAKDETALFISKNGNRISARNVQKRLKKLGQELNINLHPHIFRHSFASHMLEASSDLRAVSELLGHSDLSSTQIYTKIDFSHLASVYDKTHPLADKFKDKS